MARKDHCLVCKIKGIDDTNRAVTCYDYFDQLKKRRKRVCLCSLHYEEVHDRYGLPAPRVYVPHYSDDL